jgi:hypothetical protein
MVPVLSLLIPAAPGDAARLPGPEGLLDPFAGPHQRDRDDDDDAAR